MKLFIHSNIKFVIVLISVFIIGYAWFYRHTHLAIMGAIIYTIGLLFDLAELIILSRQFKKGEESIAQRRPIDKITTGLEVLLVISSLIAMAPENDLYRIPGLIIWLGQVVVFALLGPIIEIFADIPMEMTYGGWRPRRYRGRRK